MTGAQLRAAIAAVKAQRQRIAFDANVEKEYHVGTPYAVACAAKYDELSAVIAALEAELMRDRKAEKA